MPKNRFLLVSILLSLAVAVGIGFFLGQPSNDTPRPGHQPTQETPMARNTQPGHAGTSSLSAEINQVDKPFWEDADVPDPGEDEPAALAVIPRPQGTIIVRDYESEVKALEKDGDMQQLNDSLMLWFHQNPSAATAWINETERFEAIAPSLHLLAQGMASQGHLDTALTWADSITDPAKRQDTLRRIYAHEARQRRVTREALQQKGFSQEDITVIFSGELGD
ncbi:hypothetical protein SAMN02745166_00418 [Prosthecobacter debontii]|uniref:Uncharacterized protein n=2 Tax=Prosthecobacter debontii TaxID=48467 RepID=A0A1T4WK46_9BACT|nr:hypothetical protein SAMN02745166_00418 [Prosthecobacter debontii]